MRLWFREVAGWLLVALGLWMLIVCYDLVQASRLFEAGPMSIIGIVVFRAGIHLLKVAVAARICLQAKERTDADKTARPVRTSTSSS
jgi:hypothetical protein